MMSENGGYGGVNIWFIVVVHGILGGRRAVPVLYWESGCELFESISYGFQSRREHRVFADDPACSTSRGDHITRRECHKFQKQLFNISSAKIFSMTNKTINFLKTLISPHALSSTLLTLDPPLITTPPTPLHSPPPVAAAYLQIQSSRTPTHSLARPRRRPTTDRPTDRVIRLT
ncbi:hypothetical protein EDC01DRAFT_332981 [Geopyxis carbonaria]|nr:hypothetical protein EDC01DRAFT_332981 [Geopyxis carbonaria]